MVQQGLQRGGLWGLVGDLLELEGQGHLCHFVPASVRFKTPIDLLCLLLDTSAGEYQGLSMRHKIKGCADETFI